MRGINRVFLMGHIGQDPVVRQTPSGRALCDLTVATNRPVRSGETWTEAVEWHHLRLWEQRAELAMRYLSKGAPVAIEGQLRNESWTDAQGARRTRTYVQVDQIHLLPSPRRERSAERPALPGSPSADPPGDGAITV